MITLTILKPIATLSPVIKALGAIKTDVAHRPAAHTNEMSCEDFLRTTRTIKGMSHNGRITAAQKLIVLKLRPLPTGPRSLANWPCGDLCQCKKFNQGLHAFLDLRHSQRCGAGHAKALHVKRSNGRGVQ